MATTTKTNIQIDNMQRIEYFLNKEKIPYLYFNCTQVSDANGKIKKKISGLPGSWHTWSYDKCMEENKKDKGNHNMISVNLRNSGFCIIDIDDKDWVEKLMDKYGYTHLTESCSKKLPHLWRRIPKEDAKCKNVSKDWGDIMYTQSFEKMGSELLIWDDDVDIPEYKSEVVKREPKKQMEQYAKQYDPNKVSEYDRDILDNIDVKYWENFDDWFKLVGAIVKEKNNTLLADEYSKKASNYGGWDEVVKRTENARNADISWGTVMYYSKLSNPEKHQKIMNMHRIDIDLTDAGVATMLLKMKPDDFVFQDGILYYCNGSNPFWKYDDEDNGVKHKIYLDLLDFYSKKDLQISYLLNKVNLEIVDLERAKKQDKDKILNKYTLKTKLTEERDQIKKGELHAKTNNRKSNYVAALKEQLSHNETRIMFDTLRPNVFCFQNCNIDIVTGEKVEIYKHDYITKRVDYDYIKSTADEYQELKEIIERILSEPEVRKCYMSILWCGMLGQQIEKFPIVTGGGRNGKGVVNELFAALLTKIYFYTGSVTLITENLKGGANQEVANMDTKRTILFSEPNDSLKIKLSTVKNLTGSTEIVGRALYSKKTEVLLQNMTILECNTIPGIEGDIDTSAAERFIIIDFTATFTNDKKVLELNKNSFPLDTRYKTDAFKQKFKCVLFDYLMSYKFTGLYLPDIVRERTQRYLVGCDDFLTWFNENYTFTDSDKDMVKLKDLHENFRRSDMWETMPKATRRSKWAKNKMQLFIKRNISLGVYFKERYHKGGIDVTNVLTNYRLLDISEV